MTEHTKKTTVRVKDSTRAWALRHHMNVSSVLHAAPAWHDTMEQNGQEIIEMRANMMKLNAKYLSLVEENASLLKFKNTAIERWKLRNNLENTGKIPPVHVQSAEGSINGKAHTNE